MRGRNRQEGAPRQREGERVNCSTDSTGLVAIASGPDDTRERGQVWTGDERSARVDWEEYNNQAGRQVAVRRRAPTTTRKSGSPTNIEATRHKNRVEDRRQDKETGGTREEQSPFLSDILAR